MNSGPIILIEDDVDDKDIVLEALKELGNTQEVKWFDNCADAWLYLKSTDEQAFVIICDINLPKQNGMEFKLQLDEDEDMRKKSIPLVLYSTSVDSHTVNDAYTKMTVQGFFQKENSFTEIKRTLEVILNYWERCKHPNTCK